MTPRPPRHAERGLTLTELTLATAIASVVMIGLVGFYMTSQGVWMDSSDQAMTQREATSLVKEITDRARSAASVTIVDSPSNALQSITFFDVGNNPVYRCWYNPSDSLVHAGKGAVGDLGPVAVSRVDRFHFENTDTAFVQFEIRMHSPERHVVAVTAGIHLQNYQAP